MIRDPRSRIISKKSWNDYHLLSLESREISRNAQPGQFVMIRATSQPYPLLRRPFSIHSATGHNLEVFFKVTGVGTSLLSQKEEGKFLDVLGPLGKGFQLETVQEEEVYVVGGGRGIAPLYFLAQRLRSLKASIKIYYGGKSLADIPLRENFEKAGFSVACSTEDGTFGFKGLVTELLRQECENFLPARIFACGPEAMMKSVAQICRSREIRAEFSLESLMGCGFGACWGCIRRIKRGDEEEWLKTCEEGPVFPDQEIIWAEDE